MYVTTRHLWALASELTGKSVKVHLGHDLSMNVNGVASHDGETYVIHLNPWLFKFREVKELGETFRHECGHIAKGHVPIQSKRHSRESIDEATNESIKDGVYYPTRAAQLREAEADAWEEAHRTAAPNSYIWELTTSG